MESSKKSWCLDKRRSKCWNKLSSKRISNNVLTITRFIWKLEIESSLFQSFDRNFNTRIFIGHSPSYWCRSGSSRSKCSVDINSCLCQDKPAIKSKCYNCVCSTSRIRKGKERFFSNRLSKRFICEAEHSMGRFKLSWSFKLKFLLGQWKDQFNSLVIIMRFD